MNGYILLHKKVMKSDIWNKPPLYFKVFMYLLMRAQYQEYNGLERGQVLTSLSEIQEACSYYVGYRKEVPTKEQIRGVIDYLRSTPRTPLTENTTENTANTPMITTTKTTRGFVATICNYNVYQGSEICEEHSEEHAEEHSETQHEEHNEDQHEPTHDKEIRYKENKKEDRNISPYINIRTMYLEACVSYPKIRNLNEDRKKAIRARLNSGYSIDDFKQLFEMAERSDFLKGKNNRNWRADFDWLIKDRNMARVLEGKYENKTGKAAAETELEKSYAVMEQWLREGQ